MNVISDIKYFVKGFRWMKSYNSPFKPPVPKFYLGKVAVGTPYFLPRRWVKDKTKPGHHKAVPKRFSFDFVSMGWKTKWDSYRFEWSPVWSFVFFKWQMAITFVAPEQSHYWECWLYYTNNTDKKLSTKERIEIARKEYPCNWTISTGGERTSICYWDVVLKKKYTR
jgi:hypothetical protein